MSSKDKAYSRIIAEKEAEIIDLKRIPMNLTELHHMAHRVATNTTGAHDLRDIGWEQMRAICRAFVALPVQFAVKDLHNGEITPMIETAARSTVDSRPDDFELVTRLGPGEWGK